MTERTSIGLDFETYGAIDLPKHGLHRYVNNPTFMPLLAAAVQWSGTASSGQDRASSTSSRATRTQRDAVARRCIDGRHDRGAQRWVRAGCARRRWASTCPSSRFIDSACWPVLLGAAGKLEAAAPQLLGVDKMEVGRRSDQAVLHAW